MTQVRVLMDFDEGGVAYKSGQIVDFSDVTIITARKASGHVDDAAAALAVAVAAGGVTRFHDIEKRGPVSVSAASFAPIYEKLRLAATAAVIANPVDLPAYGSGPSAGKTVPTITQDAAAAGGLSVTKNFATGGVLGSEAALFEGLPFFWTQFTPYQLMGATSQSNAAVAEATQPAAGLQSFTPSQIGVAGEIVAAGARTNWWGQGAVIETITDADTLCLNFSPFNSLFYRLQVDGQFVNAAPQTLINGGGAYLNIAFGSRAERRVTIETQMPIIGLRRAPLTRCAAPPSSDVVRAVFVGDSYVGGQGLTTAEGWFQGWCSIAAAKLGWRDPRRISLGGTGFVRKGTSSLYANYRERLPDVMRHNPEVLIIQGSVNDVNDGYSYAQVLAEATLCLRAYRAAFPAVPIIVTGSFPAVSGPSALTLSQELAISDAVTGMADSNMLFVPVSRDATPWINGTGRVGATNGSGNSDLYMSSDGLHPNLAGHSHIGRQFVKAVRNWIMTKVA